mmetsp:Transcript_23119/g.50668  ORF Transcript_23119/g.50668 Transcript_23119/m.50668 type:complete len:416 (-) Transcript_23119:486-1733(-)
MRSTRRPRTPGKWCLRLSTVSARRLSRSLSFWSALASRSLPSTSSSLVLIWSCWILARRPFSFSSLNFFWSDTIVCLSSFRLASRSACLLWLSSAWESSRCTLASNSVTFCSKLVFSSLSLCWSKSNTSFSCFRRYVLDPASSFLLLYSASCSSAKFTCPSCCCRSITSLAKASSAALMSCKSCSSFAISATFASSACRLRVRLLSAALRRFVPLFISSLFFTSKGFCSSSSILCFSTFRSTRMLSLTAACWSFFTTTISFSACSCASFNCPTSTVICLMASRPLSSSLSKWYNWNRWDSFFVARSSSLRRKCLSASSFCILVIFFSCRSAFRFAKFALHSSSARCFSSSSCSYSAFSSSDPAICSMNTVRSFGFFAAIDSTSPWNTRKLRAFTMTPNDISLALYWSHVHGFPFR